MPLVSRSVRQADGLDPVRALQRVLYRSAEQDPERRFHALLDKVAPSDVMLRAWNDVAANRGAPGVDGVSITDIKDGSIESVRVFLDELAAKVRWDTYRPQPLNCPAAGHDPHRRHRSGHWHARSGLSPGTAAQP